jgi:hypothetical protein
MAEEPHQTSEPTAGELPGRSHRTAPVIEGEVAAETAVSSEPSPLPEPEHRDEPAMETVAASEAELAATPASPPVAPAARRASLWPVAVGLVVGALVAVGGAFGLSTYVVPPADPALDTRLAALTSRVAALEQKPAPAPNSGATAQLEQRVAALDARVAAAETAAKAAADSAGEARKAAEAATSTPGAGTAPAPQADLAPLTARVEALTKRVAPLETALAETKTQIRATEDRDAAAAQQGAQAPALAVAAESLLRAVEQGGPFAAQLAVVEKLGVDPARLAALRPLAETGVPGPARLRASLAPAAAAAAPADAAAPDSGILDHIKASAARLVQIRKVGEPDGGGDTVAKIFAAVDRGDVAGALALWDTLPPGPKGKSQAFADAAKARLAALAAAHAIEAESVAALVKARS